MEYTEENVWAANEEKRCANIRNKEYHKRTCRMLWVTLKDGIAWFGQTYYERYDWTYSNIPIYTSIEWYVSEKITPEELTRRKLVGHTPADCNGD